MRNKPKLTDLPSLLVMQVPLTKLSLNPEGGSSQALTGSGTAHSRILSKQFPVWHLPGTPAL